MRLAKLVKKFSGARKKTARLAALCMLGTAGLCLNSVSVQAASRQIEALDRGLVAVKSGDGVYLSWRLLGTENYDIGFNVYRNGTKIAGPITDSTNYQDAGGTANDIYTVRTVVNGEEQTESDAVSVWANNYLDVPIEKPGDIYSANDASVADVDGDGAYEIILKWDPSDSKDNSQKGVTSNVYIDCYEMDGTKKWRIDLGQNIRAGAHYTQFIAYDLDGDGKAEVAMKTADGTVAGDGTVIGDASKDYRNSNGYILEGPEYLTLFEGETGKILQTLDYEPARGDVSSWGDSYGNRVDRFLATVAYLDGQTPSLVMCRGYYTRAVLVAYQYKNGSLQKQWTFDSNDNSAYKGQGNHNLTSADVDNDGCDEIVYGSCVIDHNGTGLYSTGMGHGDAMHVSDFDPEHEGLEVFQVHEETGENVESVQMRDAKTGQTLWSVKTGTDVGRGIIANIDPDYGPYVAIASSGKYDKNGNTVDITMNKFGVNFLIWWDGDLYREGLDRTYINKWNYNTKSEDRLLTGSDVHANNSTKYNPSLSGDILGDWREEVIWPKSDDTALRIYTTTTVTSKKLYTLVHDIQYRESLAWQNVAYNQPPHTSYYMGEDMPTPTQPDVYTVGTYKETEVDENGEVVLKEGAVLEEGLYTIKNLASNAYLDVTGGTAANGTNVQQWGATEATSYNTWKLQKTEDGYYKIYSLVGDGSYLLDLDYGNAANGTNIQIYQDTACDAQLFKFVKNADGSYAIVTKITNDKSGLAVADDSTSYGANICQWLYTGKDSQKWLIRRVPTEEEKNPLVKYQFENAENNIITDAGTNGNNAVLYGNAACVTDRERGNVLYLDGTDGTYVELPTGIFDEKTDITISMNVKSESEGNFFTFTVGKDSTDYYFTNMSKTAVRSAITTEGWQQESSLSSDVDATQWHNYTIVLSENTMKIYVDGILSAESSDVKCNFADLGSDLVSYIGKSFFAADSYFKGYIDNFEAYQYALSEQEISDLVKKNFSEQHDHVYGSGWKQDETNHWYICEICGEEKDLAEHSFGEWTVSKAATCTEAGEQWRSCSICGYKQTEEITAGAHSIDQTTWKKDADRHWYECSVCGEKQDEATHTMEWVVDKEATETETGSRHEECSVCGYEGKTEEIPANHSHGYGTAWETDADNHWHECSCGLKQDEAAHTMEWVVDKEATEIEAGSRHEECSVCGYKGKAEEIPANHSHDYGTAWKADADNHWHECSCGLKQDEAAHTMEWVVDKEATETEAGSRHEECSVCGYKGKAEEIPANHSHDYGTAWKTDADNHWHECSCGLKQDEAAHTFSEWQLIKEPTCETKGLELRTCSICGLDETRDVAATGHIVNEATWESNEDSHWHACSCGLKQDEAGHTMKWVVDTPVTETTAGIRHEECSVCGYIGKTESIPVSHVHTYETTWEKDANAHWHICSGCGEKQDEAVHTFSEWKVIKEVDCVTAGMELRTCSVCGLDETREVTAAGHNVNETVWEKDATNHWHACSTCGEESDKAVHTLSWVVDKAATGTETGSRHEECSVCGYIGKTEEIPAGHTHDYESTWKNDTKSHWHECSSCGEKADEAEHTFTEWKAVKEPTCTEKGLETRSCKVCGLEETKEIPVTGHTMTDNTWKTNESSHWHECGVCGEKADAAQHTMKWIVDREGTEDTPGVRHEECSVCGYTGKSEEIPVTHTHTYGSTWKADATNHWHECGCGAHKDESTHNYEWIVDVPATIYTEGRQHQECKECGYVGKEEMIVKIVCEHPNKEVFGKADATVSEEGYTGDTYCLDCGVKLLTGTVIPKISEEQATTQQPAQQQSQTPKKNDVVEVKTGSQTASYQITNAATDGTGTVTYKASKSPKVTGVKIPDKITIQGITYKVTAIANNAFKNNSQIKSVTIGSNVKTIGNNAFYKCKKLTKVVIGKNVTKIGKNAFYKASKLKTITIKSKKLKSVGKNAIKGIHKKAVIKVPKTKKKAYKKLFKKSTGFSSGMKIK